MKPAETCIEDEWRHYESRVVPPEAGQCQRDDLRAAFYAGSWIAFGTIERAANNLSEDDATCYIEAVYAVCHQVIKDMGPKLLANQMEIQLRKAQEQRERKERERS